MMLRRGVQLRGLVKSLDATGIKVKQTRRVCTGAVERATPMRRISTKELFGLPKLSVTSLHTSSVLRDQCIPSPLPPLCPSKKCIVAKAQIIQHCKEKKRPKWTGCEKICMPCCCPAIDPPDCEKEVELRVNTCKRIEYRIPSFVECRKFTLNTKSRKECCEKAPPCPEAGIENMIERLVSTKVRQETILGRRSGNKFGSSRSFATSAVLLRASASSKDCKSNVKPCLKPSGVHSKHKTSKKACEKRCMPCCKPGRDPPECYYPYVKTSCTRLKAPRPSFSECEKEKVANIQECECRVGPTSCQSKDSSSVGSCE